MIFLSITFLLPHKCVSLGHEIFRPLSVDELSQSVEWWEVERCVMFTSLRMISPSSLSTLNNVLLCFTTFVWFSHNHGHGNDGYGCCVVRKLSGCLELSARPFFLSRRILFLPLFFCHAGLMIFLFACRKVILQRKLPFFPWECSDRHKTI